MTTIAAIIPAFNEGQTIASVVEVFLRATEIAEVVVVNDGSSDETALRAEAAGARVITQENQGKGAAMRAGALATDAEYIFFADGDLVGFTVEHIRALINPVLTEGVAMTVGLRDRGAVLTPLLPHVAPVLGGERVMRRDVFLAMSSVDVRDFGIETVMNAYCRDHGLAVKNVMLPGLTQVLKEQKYGLLKGFHARVRMFAQVFGAMLATRPKNR